MYERTLSSRRLFQGRVVTLDVLDIELEDGHRSHRELVRHPGGVGILAREPDGHFLLVRQFRKAVESEVVEICAGTVEPGEPREETARRELREETGREATRLVPLGDVYASPGYTDEVVSLFFAECAPHPAAGAGDADERVELVRATEAEIEEWIRQNLVRDAKTLAAWLLYRMQVRA